MSTEEAVLSVVGRFLVRRNMMKKLEVAPDQEAAFIAWSDVLEAINANSPDADAIGAAYLRQQFPPRSMNEAYLALVHYASGIDYGRKHEAVVDLERTIINLGAVEQREEYEQTVMELELAARGIYLSEDLSA